MKRLVLLVAGLLLCGWGSAQEVGDVRFTLQDNELTILYDLSAPADIIVRVSVDRGATFGSPLQNLSGDVGKNVPAGIDHRIIAYNLLDIRGVDPVDLRFLVEVDDGSVRVYVKNLMFRMMPVEGGSFSMGCAKQGLARHTYESQKPVHKVTVSDFYMASHEVTQALWKVVMDTNPSYWIGNDSLPVEQVSWADAQLFIARLSQMTGYRFRLPTEAEWEYAARGGKFSTGQVFPGNDGSHLEDYSWYCVNAANRTHPVGQKLPNELGLYDMGGNVSEWCADWIGLYSPQQQTNPRGPKSGEFRVLRGGSISSPSYGCTVSDRCSYIPSVGYNCYGFRLVMDSAEQMFDEDLPSPNPASE